MTWQRTSNRDKLRLYTGLLTATFMGLVIASFGSVFALWHQGPSYEHLADLQRESAEESQRLKVALAFAEARSSLNEYLAFGRDDDRKAILSYGELINGVGSNRISQSSEPEIASLRTLYTDWESQFARPLLVQRSLVDSGKATRNDLDALYASLYAEKWDARIHEAVQQTVDEKGMGQSRDFDSASKGHAWDSRFYAVVFGSLAGVNLVGIAINFRRFRLQALGPALQL